MGLNSHRQNTILGIGFAAILAASGAFLPLTTANIAYAAPANLTVNANSTSGAVLNMQATIQSGGSIVGSGFTPLSITGNTGTTYTITPSDYSGITFVRWEDGSTTRTRSLTLNSATSITAVYNTGTSASTLSCAPLTVTGWIASGDDGNKPANTLDNNFSTRWSNLGKGSWIRYDLGQSRTVCDLDVAWYKGNERQSSFVVSVSQDDKTYTNVYTGKSSGTTLNQEDYNIPDTAARYVKITVNGNTSNDWASIAEVDISGVNSSSTPPPAPTTYLLTVKSADMAGSTLTGYQTSIKEGSVTVQTGYTTLTYTGKAGATYSVTVSDYGNMVFDHWNDGTTARTKTLSLNAGTTITAHFKSTTTQTPPPPTGSTNDVFGVKMLYPTKSAGEAWAMNMDSATSDSRFDPQDTITKNSDGSWKMKSSQVRMSVFTSSGYHPERITTYNQAALATKGYMQNANDWKNIEITGFVKVISASDDNFAWYGRGGKHTDSDGGCEGTSYKGRLFYNGEVNFAKEQQHADGYSFTSESQATTSLFGRWVGFKTVMYNNAQGNVVLQNWINENADRVTWKKVAEKVDGGGWGSDGDMCGGTPDQKITWGGPISTFRWDSASNVDFKWLSVREIQPPT